MTTISGRPVRRFGRLPASVLVLTLLLGACASAGTAASPGTASSPPAASIAPSFPATQPGGNPPGMGGPDGELVVPKPGQLDVHPIAADSLAAQVDGRRVIVTITYTSGVEPCSVLDTIVVERGERSFAITLREGHGPGNQVCIMIAKVMKAQVDLGELDPGTYTISDTTRGADPIQVVVS